MPWSGLKTVTFFERHLKFGWSFSWLLVNDKMNAMISQMKMKILTNELTLDFAILPFPLQG